MIKNYLQGLRFTHGTREKASLRTLSPPNDREAQPTCTPKKGRWLGPVWQLLPWDPELQTDVFDYPHNLLQGVSELL